MSSDSGIDGLAQLTRLQDECIELSQPHAVVVLFKNKQSQPLGCLHSLPFGGVNSRSDPRCSSSCSSDSACAISVFHKHQARPPHLEEEGHDADFRGYETYVHLPSGIRSYRTMQPETQMREPHHEHSSLLQDRSLEAQAHTHSSVVPGVLRHTFHGGRNSATGREYPPPRASTVTGWATALRRECLLSTVLAADSAPVLTRVQRGGAVVR